MGEGFLCSPEGRSGNFEPLGPVERVYRKGVPVMNVRIAAAAVLAVLAMPLAAEAKA